MSRIYGDGIDSLNGSRYISSDLGNVVHVFKTDFFSKQINQHWDNWALSLPPEISQSIIIFTEFEPSVTNTTRKEYNSGIYKRYKYRQFAAFYGNIHGIDTTEISDKELTSLICQIINQENREHLIPKLNEFNDEMFNSLPLVIDTNSKIVRKYNENYHIIAFKPNVYSFKLKGIHSIPHTDIERVKMTKEIIEIISRDGIPHTYLFVGDKYILTKALYNQRDLPNVETIVKKKLIGSDGHNYYNIKSKGTRFNMPLVNENSEYNNTIVRFDYRNPEFIPETNVVLGDYTMCDDLADEFIDVKEAKKIAKNCFNTGNNAFKEMKLDFCDVCFMITINGKEIYAEISQDCMRICPENLSKLTEKEQIIWKSGGSTEDYVLYRYEEITRRCKDYVKKVGFYEIQKEDFC